MDDAITTKEQIVSFFTPTRSKKSGNGFETRIRESSGQQ
jgi:hypothetical protein